MSPKPFRWFRANQLREWFDCKIEFYTNVFNSDFRFSPAADQLWNSARELKLLYRWSAEVDRVKRVKKKRNKMPRSLWKTVWHTSVAKVCLCTFQKILRLLRTWACAELRPLGPTQTLPFSLQYLKIISMLCAEKKFTISLFGFWLFCSLQGDWLRKDRLRSLYGLLWLHLNGFSRRNNHRSPLDQPAASAAADVLWRLARNNMSHIQPCFGHGDDESSK